MTWLYRSSVPGMSVPGMAVPALDGSSGSPSGPFTYIGHVPAFYLDYLDVLTQETLSVVPGGAYPLIAVNSRAGLTVPPPDNCWRTPTNRWAPRIVLRPRLVVPEVPPPVEVLALEALYGARDVLTRARVRNVSLQAYRSSRPARPQPHGSPSPVSAPVVLAAPSEAAVAMAAARALNASRQAAMARGELVGC